MFYKRKIADLAFQDRTNITTTDYTRFETPMPDVSRDPDVAAVLKAGEMVPVYNLNPAKLTVFNVGVVDRSDTTNDTLYTGFEASFSARLPGGAMMFGSWTAEHTLQRWCDNDDDPNGPTTTGQFNPTAATTGVDAPLGGRYCDQTQFPFPFLHDVRCPTHVMAGSLSDVMPPESARRFADAIPGATLELVDGAGHHLELERSKLVAERIRELAHAADDR